MSRFVEIDCAGTVTLEWDDGRNLHFHDFDEEAELAAVAIGFEPSLCLLLRDFIINRDLHFRFDPSITLLVMLEGGARPRINDLGDILEPLAPAYLGGAVEALIGLGGDPNYSNIYKESLLTLAASNVLFEAIPPLLEAGASPTANKSAAFRWAAEFGQDEIVKMLLEAGADINAMSGAALFRAAEQNHPSTVQLLLEEGIDLSNEVGERAAFAAVEEGNVSALQLLLKAGVDPHWSDDIMFREVPTISVIYNLLEEYA